MMEPNNDGADNDPHPLPWDGDIGEEVHLDILEILKLSKDLRRKRRQQRQELKNLRIQEGDLEVTVKTFKQWLAEANQGMGRRVEAIGELNGRIDQATMNLFGVTGEPCGGKEGKSNCSNDVGEGDTGGMGWGRRDAVFIFPEEIWIMILGYLSTPEDLWNTSNTCLLFQDIVQKWRSRYLLEQALPQLYRHLPGKKLLECRLVSKGWRNTIDNFLEEHPSLRPYSPQGRDPRRLDFVNPMREKSLCGGSTYTFGDVGKGVLDSSREFPDRQMILGRPPFIGRYVTMAVGKDDGEPQGTWHRVFRFLTDFGKEIYYLNLFFPPQLQNTWVRRNVCYLLYRLPSMVPNLRKLRVDMGNYADRVVGKGFDAFAKLETLECDFPERFGSCPMLDILIREHHTQLRKLSLGGPAWSRFCHLAWLNLTELKLVILTPTQLGSLYGVRIPKLRRLELHILGEEQITFDNLLEALNALSTNSQLETLCLEGNFQQMRYGGLVGSSLFAPATLKSLQLKLFHRRQLPDYDFLLRCFPLVQNLHMFAVKVEWRDVVRPRQQSEMALLSRQLCKEHAAVLGNRTEEEVLEVNRYVYDGRMYESNIWELLPQLKVFSFQWDVYTREGLEAFLRRRRQ